MLFSKTPDVALSSLTSPKVNDLLYCPNFLPPFLFKISFNHSSKFYYVNDDLITENTLLKGLINITLGNPEFKLN